MRDSKARDKIETLSADLLELRTAVMELRREVQQFALDYEGLYEKVRMNLAKLRKRAESAEQASTEDNPLADARNALLARKLRRRDAV